MGAETTMPIWRFTAALAGILGMLLVVVCPLASPGMSAAWEVPSPARTVPASCARESRSQSAREGAASGCCRHSCDEGEAPASGCRVCRSAVNPSTKARELVDATPVTAAVATLPSGSRFERPPAGATLAVPRFLPAFLLFGALRN